MAHAGRALGLILALGLAGCRSGQATPAAPESAFRTFRGSLRAVAHGGDPTLMYTMLGPQTRARLEQRAEAARAVGVPDVTPAQMLDVAWAAFATDIDSVDTVESDEAGALLAVRTHHGLVWHVRAARGEDGWTFELPVPGEAPVPVQEAEREDG